MKWRSKGYELDIYGKKLTEDFKSRGTKIYIFGAGQIGEEIRPIFERYGCFAGYIDNSPKKQSLGIQGAKVFSFQEYLSTRKDGVIAIAADVKNIPSIKAQLMQAGLREKEDFYEHTEFIRTVFPVLSVYLYNQFFVELAQICLTERCSLKCKACAHGCYAVDSGRQDMSIEEAEKSADFFFDKVDLIQEFVLIGGEPFLYKALDKIILYIGEKYRDKMLTFSITTNGTIIPDEKVMYLCKKYNVLVRISNYSSTLHYLEKKYEQLITQLKKNSVSYSLCDADYEWMDYGFETVDRKWNEEELIRVFDKCKTPCREIRGSRYYYCVMARTISENLGFDVGKEDYLDLNKIEKNDKKVLLEFQTGYSQKGYLDMCNYCNGAEAVNHPIPVAEQL